MNRRELLKFIPAAGFVATLFPSLLRAEPEAKPEPKPEAAVCEVHDDYSREPFITTSQLLIEFTKLLDQKMSWNGLERHQVSFKHGHRVGDIASVGDTQVAFTDQVTQELVLSTHHFLLPMKDFSKRYLVPAATQMANAINFGLSKYRRMVVFGDLYLPGGVARAGRLAHPSGLTVRAIQAYDINRDVFPLRLDILYGGQ